MKMLLLAALAILVTACAARNQGYSVRGQLFCSSNPWHQNGVKVTLVNEGSGNPLGEYTTTADGRFEISGSTNEATDIKPRLYIYTNCNNGAEPCQRKIKYPLPKSYINRDSFNMERISLDAKGNNEERYCMDPVQSPDWEPRPGPDVRGIKQSYAVKGSLFCMDRPASGIKVRLVDEDDGLDPDDIMDETTTDGSGNFQLSGTERERTKIDPRLKIYHDCNDGNKPCQRKWTIHLPSKYINKGTPIDIGHIYLEAPPFPDEERDCLH